MEDTRAMLFGRWPEPADPILTKLPEDNAELAQQLLAIIIEIYDASRGIPESEIRKAGLHGVVTSQQIEGSGYWLYVEMGKLAAEGRSREMLAFYENCLRSERGRIIGWALDRLGRTSMESEAERFRSLSQTRAAFSLQK
ncbi:MAG: hypothetical protein H8D78_21920 [Chloroflexi bacterium]|nr:hypothetical protein [Chloroflexota bacterium]